MFAMVELIQHVRLRWTEAPREAQKLLRIEMLPTEYDHLVAEKHLQDRSERPFVHLPGQVCAADLGAHGVAGTLRGQHDSRAQLKTEARVYRRLRVPSACQQSARKDLPSEPRQPEFKH